VPPSSPPSSSGFDADVLTVQTAAAVATISALGSAGVLAAILLHPASYRMSHYVFSISVASFLNALAYIWGWVSHGEPGFECQVQATLFIFSEDAMAIFSLAVALHVYQLLVLRRLFDRLELLCYAVGWGLPAIASAILLAIHGLGPVTEKPGLWCWIRDADGGMTANNVVWWSVVSIDCFRWLVFAVITVLYFRVRRAFGSLVLEGLLAPSRERRVLRRLWQHLLVFLLTRILFVLINVYALIWPSERLPWPCYFCSAVAAASTGMLNAIVYGCSPEAAITGCHERAAGCNLLAGCQRLFWCCPGCRSPLLVGRSPKSAETPFSALGHSDEAGSSTDCTGSRSLLSVAASLARFET